MLSFVVENYNNKEADHNLVALITSPYHLFWKQYTTVWCHVHYHEFFAGTMAWVAWKRAWLPLHMPRARNKTAAEKHPGTSDIKLLDHQNSWKYCSHKKVVKRKVVQLGETNQGDGIHFCHRPIFSLQIFHQSTVVLSGSEASARASIGKDMIRTASWQLTLLRID